MILMKKSMLVFMSCIFCVFAANAGFLSGLKMTVYYPYQVRTVMPMTGPSVVQCNYADPEITVMFSSDGVPTEVMEKGNSYELEYYDTFDGNDIYTMDENRYISVKSDGACIVDTSTSSFGGQPIYIDYTINDCRGGSSSYGGGYSGVAMTEGRQAHIPHAVFVEALESVQVAMDGAANGAVLGITQVPARRHG